MFPSNNYHKLDFLIGHRMRFGAHRDKSIATFPPPIVHYLITYSE